MRWTDERVDRLKQLWKEGLSCSQIARQLGGVTRNAVIGKVHRLGLTGQQGKRAPRQRGGGHLSRAQSRTIANANKRKANLKAKPASYAVRAIFRPDAEPFVPSGEELVIPLAERQTVATLESHHCRWPIGDPQHADFHFCGKNKVPGLPYCEFHARRAFQPPQPRRRDSDDVSREAVCETISVTELEKV